MKRRLAKVRKPEQRPAADYERFDAHTGRISPQHAKETALHYLALCRCDLLPEEHRAGAREAPCPLCVIKAGDIIDGHVLDALMETSEKAQQKKDAKTRSAKRGHRQSEAKRER